MKYEVVIFDADGVLFDFERTEIYALKQLIKYYKWEKNPEYYINHYREINAGVWDEFERGLISSEALKCERFRRFFNRLGISQDPSETSLKYLDFLSEGSFLLGKPFEVLDKFKDRVKMILITNGFSRIQRERLKKANLIQYFEAIIISEEVGCAKPDPEIFKIALDKINYLKKHKVLMVGDSIKSDIMGGTNYGIDTCWFNPSKKENKVGIKPTYEIQELMELEEIVFKGCLSWA